MIRVLVVDDDEQLTMLLQRALQQHGYVVDVAYSAEAGLEAIRARPYCAVVLDWVMDGIGGAGFLQRYREIDPLLIVIVVTAYPRLENALRALSGGVEAPAVAYIQKPEARLPERIVETVEKYITRQTAGDFLIDRQERAAFWISDEGRSEALHLTPTELDLFELLARSARPLTYSDLVWELRRERMDAEEAKNSLRGTMSRLRKKVRDVTGYEAIRSEPQVGFWVLSRRSRGRPVAADTTAENEQNHVSGSIVQ